MSAFHAPTDDILTSLNLAAKGLPGWDRDMAAEIISHVGARPDVGLKTLAGNNGLL